MQEGIPPDFALLGNLHKYGYLLSFLTIYMAGLAKYKISCRLLNIFRTTYIFSHLIELFRFKSCKYVNIFV